jgi:hypothetical protein
MSTIKSKTIEGFNSFLDTQKADNNLLDTMTVLSFHGSQIVTIQDNIAVEDVPSLSQDTYKTIGTTNLLDAMGYAMNLPGPAIVVTLTDGEENSSKEHNIKSIKTLKEQREAEGWSFLFLGANIDTFAVGNQLGFVQHNTIDYDINNIGHTMLAASQATNMLKSRKVGETYDAYAFTEAQRSAAKVGNATRKPD